jgi:hypothetical protein
MQPSPDWRTPDWEPEPVFWCANDFALLLFLSDPDRFGKCWGTDPRSIRNVISEVLAACTQSNV